MRNLGCQIFNRWVGQYWIRICNTRHNIGFDIADAFVSKHEEHFQDRLAELQKLKWKGKTCHLYQTITYMNLSGKAVKYWMDKEKIPLENILVIVDEVAFP